MLLPNAMLFPVTCTHGNKNTQTVCYNYGFETLKTKKAVKVKEKDIQFWAEEQRELIECDCVLFAGVGCSVIVLLCNSMRFLRLSQ